MNIGNLMNLSIRFASGSVISVKLPITNFAHRRSICVLNVAKYSVIMHVSMFIFSTIKRLIIYTLPSAHAFTSLIDWQNLLINIYSHHLYTVIKMKRNINRMTALVRCYSLQ